MGRIGSLPSVPEEFVEDVASTSWALANTQRDRTLVVRAVPQQLVTQCPSCRDRLVIDVVAARAQSTPNALESPVSSVMRYATPVAASTPLSAVVELLAEPSRRLLTVVDSQQRPLGVLTHTQLLSAVKGRTREELAEMTALDASTWGGPHLPEDVRLGAAARELVSDDREFALVVDADGKLLGVVLAIDFLASL